MSLLPQQILPPETPIGVANADGIVVLAENWWLFFYNIWLNTVATGMPADALQAFESVDIDAADSDAISLRALSQQALQPTDSLIEPIDSRALLLAQDGLLPDVPARAQPVTSVVVGASPFTFTASFAGTVVITGGTVSAITMTRQSTSVATGLTTGLIPVCRLDQVTVTFTGAPTMTFIPWSPA